MIRGSPRLRHAVLILLFASAAAAAEGLSGSQERGKRIYLEGTGRHPIHALLVKPGIKAPGSAFPCVKCHLDDGEGQFEGGVRSANIGYYVLTSDYTGVRPSGRSHPPYTDEALATAVTRGRDPAGNELNPVHPRYEMSKEDLADLVAYLRILGREPVPGISGDEIRVGSLLPAAGPLSGAASEVTALLSAYFDDLNARGGLYGRKVRFVPVPFDPGRPDGAANAVRKVLSDAPVFCFVANMGIPLESDAAGFLASRKVPVIGPLLIPPTSSYNLDRNTFYLYASFQDQARVMVDFLSEKALVAPPLRISLLYPRNREGEGGASGAKDQMKRYGRRPPAEEAFPPGRLDAAGAVLRLRESGPDAVLFFGGEADAVAFLDEADRRGWHPVFVGSAVMVGAGLSRLPEQEVANVYLASPIERPDPSSAGTTEFRDLRERRRLSGKHGAFERMAFAGAKLLTEGLRLSGRAVTRGKLVGRLGALFAFDSGVTPPLSYNENRRIGASGAAIVRLDGKSRRFLPVRDWREPRFD